MIGSTGLRNWVDKLSHNILSEIVSNKESEILRSKQKFSPEEMLTLAKNAPQPLDFYAAIDKTPTVSIIAECKKQSPSKGLLCHEYDPISIAKSYERGGAKAVSVLTDHSYFGGSLRDLRDVKDNLSIPVFRKDFIFEDYQIWESRFYGADSFLLIAGILDSNKLQYLLEVGRQFNMEPLVEIHSLEDLDIVRNTDLKICGINCRNLKNFNLDRDYAREVLQKARSALPTVTTFIFESGVKTKEEIEELSEEGFSGFLIGESLMKDSDPEEKLKLFIS